MLTLDGQMDDSALEKLRCLSAGGTKKLPNIWSPSVVGTWRDGPMMYFQNDAIRLLLYIHV